jgi:hypothetical protein
MIETNEETTLVISTTFKDENNALVVPISVDYRIDDIQSKTQIRDWTTVSTPTSVIDIVITADENVMISSRKTYEDRMLTVRFTYSGEREGLAEQLFRVKNIKFA